jgi:hypothetical protein
MRDKRDIGIRSGYPAAAIIDGANPHLKKLTSRLSVEEMLRRYWRSYSVQEILWYLKLVTNTQSPAIKLVGCLVGSRGSSVFYGASHVSSSCSLHSLLLCRSSANVYSPAMCIFLYVRTTLMVVRVCRLRMSFHRNQHRFLQLHE